MNRGLSMLGLCARAGKLVSGEKACLQAIRAESVFLALLDGGAKGNTEKAITDACAFHKIPLVKTPEFELGDAIGKPGRMVVAVADPRFAERILQLMSAQESD